MTAFTNDIDFSIKNLPSLTSFYVSIYALSTIDEKIVTRFLDQIPYIQELYLDGNFCWNFIGLGNSIKVNIEKNNILRQFKDNNDFIETKWRLMNKEYIDNYK